MICTYAVLFFLVRTTFHAFAQFPRGAYGHAGLSPRLGVPVTSNTGKLTQN